MDGSVAAWSGAPSAWLSAGWVGGWRQGRGVRAASSTVDSDVELSGPRRGHPGDAGEGCAVPAYSNRAAGGLAGA